MAQLLVAFGLLFFFFIIDYAVGAPQLVVCIKKIKKYKNNSNNQESILKTGNGA